jgi:hypothetical protein
LYEYVEHVALGSEQPSTLQSAAGKHPSVIGGLFASQPGVSHLQLVAAPHDAASPMLKQSLHVAGESTRQSGIPLS